MNRSTFALVFGFVFSALAFASVEATCGQRSHHQKFPSVKSGPEIVGGKDAVRGAYPWQVSIQMIQEGAKPFHFCGGSVIGHRWIVTAAHCINVYLELLPDLFQITVGDYRFGHIEGSEQVVSIDKIFKHESFDANTIDNDIALIRTNEKIHFGEFVQPVCVPGAKFRYDDGVEAFISGWGNIKQVIPDLGFRNGIHRNTPNVLQAAMVPFVNKTECNAPNRYQGLVTENMICAGYMAGGIDSCQGDSGGPLVIKKHNVKKNIDRFVLAGVTSWGVGCAAPDFPGVYTRMANYGSWIHEKINATKTLAFDGVEYV